MLLLPIHTLPVLASSDWIRTLVVTHVKVNSTADVPTEAMDKAIAEIERLAKKLDTISTSATTISKGAEKILDDARIMEKGLQKKTQEL